MGAAAGAGAAAAARVSGVKSSSFSTWTSYFLPFRVQMYFMGIFLSYLFLSLLLIRSFLLGQESSLMLVMRNLSTGRPTSALTALIRTAWTSSSIVS